MFKSKPVPVHALANELAQSEQQRDQQIKAAHAAHTETRASVIERGRERAAELRRLEAEARAEAEAAEDLVRRAVA